MRSASSSPGIGKGRRESRRKRCANGLEFDSAGAEIGLYNPPVAANLRKIKNRLMRTGVTLITAALALAVGGCAGPARKLGRGLNNLTELVRGGEIHRSMEQTALWDGADDAYTTGFFRGFSRSMTRTAIGAYEVVTFPFPS